VTFHRRFKLVLTLAAACGIASGITSCRGILGLDGDEPLLPTDGGNGEGEGGGVFADGASATDGNASGDGSAGGGGDGSSASDASNADAAKGGDAAPVVTSDWARWPLPASSPGAANYTLTTDTALDKTTGLMWQRAFSARINYSGAAAYCTGISDGGFHDWRVPTWIELVSIVDYSRSAPAIDTTAFTGVPSDWFWSTTVVGTTGLQQSIFFFSGKVAGLDTTAAQLWRVRCVRNP
jgi:hypothetical protein